MYIFLFLLNILTSLKISEYTFLKKTPFNQNTDNIIYFILSNEMYFKNMFFIFIKLMLVTIFMYYLFIFVLKNKKIENFKYETLLKLTEEMISKKINLGYKYLNIKFSFVISITYFLIYIKPENYNVSLFIMFGMLLGIYLYLTRKKIDYNKKALNIILNELNKVGNKENSYGEEYINMPIGILPKRNLDFFASDKFTFESSGLSKSKFNELKYYSKIKLVFENNQKPTKEYKIFKD